MALTGNDWSPADVAAVTGGGYNNDGFGGGAWWLLVLFLFAFMGNGWGNWGAGAGSGGGMTYADIAVQRGFDQSAVINGINGVQQAITTGFAAAEAAESARQIAALQQAFGMQNQLAECCCENRLGIANLANVIQTENCADRQVVSDGIRDLLVAYNSGTQRILDQMCNDKIDAKNEKIADLERQLTMMNLSASQNQQTAQIIADNAAREAAMDQYLRPVPMPAYVVPNPNCCQTQNGFGCGCGNF